MPRFSVIIPCHNAALTIARTLSSCLFQQFSDFEVVVVDDHSQDATSLIIEGLSARFAARNIALIYACNRENRGAAYSRNAGWDMASGEYLCFLDADDVWHHAKLLIIDQILKTSDYQIILHDHTDAEEGFFQPVDMGDFAISSLKLRRLLLGNPAQTSCYILKRSIKQRFDPAMRYCEDYDLWLRLSCRHPFHQLRGRPLTLLPRRQQSPGGLSANRIKMRRGEFRAYAHFAKQRQISSMLPALLAFSLLKHLRSEIRYFFNRLG
jgi:teichuronic acid biosynthesis glycosyltransferase TuaG